MHLIVKEPSWRGDPLPRGRHKLTAGTVRASQRERLLRAMVECVADRGFEATTVPMVVATARVSSNAFYDFFSDKADCFLAACDEVAGEMLSQLVSLTEEADWIQAMYKGAGLYLDWWQQRPAFARAYLLSIQSAGERTLEQRERTYAMFRAMFTDLVAEEVRAGRSETLTGLQAELAQLAIRLLADDATAERAFTDGGPLGGVA
jgi:AcrR family transcriptional regulator